MGIKDSSQSTFPIHCPQELFFILQIQNKNEYIKNGKRLKSDKSKIGHSTNPASECTLCCNQVRNFWRRYQTFCISILWMISRRPLLAKTIFLYQEYRGRRMDQNNKARHTCSQNLVKHKIQSGVKKMKSMFCTSRVKFLNCYFECKSVRFPSQDNHQ